MARPRSPGFEDQRAQILAAAARVFAQRGYTAATMNEVAAACGVSKPTLYHYVRDKHDLLAQIASTHVARLEFLVVQVAALKLAPEAGLRELILRFMRAYASAGNEHRVLTEDVKFLADAERAEVLAVERRVVAGFAAAVVALRPELKRAHLAKPVTMLLFGMINWTFTWLQPGRALDHESLAPIVVDLFVGGLAALQPRSVAPA
ncbi:MAG: TetR/AcrR family transcriptional regulator [Burkholderiales bacterium]|nr:TetR/AcrR family transcriptional regulator [Burkholderiales bacterium]MDE2397553.1 TetR/AcrR family transcriptional regulator [Burkholderiales bacterium]